jgi:hypothetical protein
MTTPPYHRALVPKKADGEPEAERWHPPRLALRPGRALPPCAVPPLNEGGAEGEAAFHIGPHSFSFGRPHGTRRLPCPSASPPLAVP